MPDTPIHVGPLEPLLSDPTVTSIQIDQQGVRFIKNGLIQTSTITFESDAQRWQLIEDILAACGETLSAEHQPVDCMLADGTRVHATHAPLLLSLDKRGSEHGI